MSIDPPWRLDPFQNIVNVGWGGDMLLVTMNFQIRPPSVDPTGLFWLTVQEKGTTAPFTTDAFNPDLPLIELPLTKTRSNHLVWKARETLSSYDSVNNELAFSGAVFVYLGKAQTIPGEFFPPIIFTVPTSFFLFDVEGSFLWWTIWVSTYKHKNVNYPFRDPQSGDQHSGWGDGQLVEVFAAAQDWWRLVAQAPIETSIPGRGIGITINKSTLAISLTNIEGYS